MPSSALKKGGHPRLPRRRGVASPPLRARPAGAPPGPAVPPAQPRGAAFTCGPAPALFFFNDTATTEIYTLSPTRRSSDLWDGRLRPPRVRRDHHNGLLRGVAVGV